MQFSWLLFFGLLNPASADTVEGVVARVLSGDTIEVLSDATKKTRVFHLMATVAPVAGEKDFEKSRQQLESLVKGKKVSVDWVKHQVCPPAGGTCGFLGKVTLKSEDIGLKMIRLGFSVHDENYKREQSPTDRVLYQDAERQAIKAKTAPRQNRN